MSNADRFGEVEIFTAGGVPLLTETYPRDVVDALAWALTRFQRDHSSGFGLTLESADGVLTTVFVPADAALRFRCPTPFTDEQGDSARHLRSLYVQRMNDAEWLALTSTGELMRP